MSSFIAPTYDHHYPIQANMLPALENYCPGVEHSIPSPPTIEDPSVMPPRRLPRRHSVAIASTPASIEDEMHVLTVRYATGLLPCNTRTEAHAEFPSFPAFARKLTSYLKADPLSKALAVVYLSRLELPSTARGEFSTPHKLYLAALLASIKFLRDDVSTEVNARVAHYLPNLFSVREICLLERGLLRELGWSMWVDHTELLGVFKLAGASPQVLSALTGSKKPILHSSFE